MIAEGKPLEGTEMITFMREQTAQTRKVLMDLNTNYHTDEEIVGLFCKITGSNVDPTFRCFRRSTPISERTSTLARMCLSTRAASFKTRAESSSATVA